MSSTNEPGKNPVGVDPGRAKPRSLSPLPVRVVVWIVLVMIALMAIRVIDRHAMDLQRTWNDSTQKTKSVEPAP